MHIGWGVGRCVKADVLTAAAQELSCKPRHVRSGHIGVHILGQDLSCLRNVRNAAELQKLVGCGLEKVVLHLDAVKIPVDIAAAVAAQPHGLLPVQKLIPRFQVDDRAVLVVHALGHIVPDAAQCVHSLLKGFQADDGVAVHIKANELFHMPPQRLAAVGPAVDRRPVYAV